MTTFSHETPRSLRLALPELWASLAISVMWLAVLVTCLWGPDFVSRSPGGNETIIPSGIPVAMFAFLATWVVARHAFRHEPE
jgi:hypothetical protein